MMILVDLCAVFCISKQLPIAMIVAVFRTTPGYGDNGLGSAWRSLLSQQHDLSRCRSLIILTVRGSAVLT